MKDNYMAQVYLLDAIRTFFKERDFLDVLTPPMVSNPGMEVHIHPFQINKAINKEETPYYLHTSPEFWMKHLLSEGLEKIFTLNYCFRDEPQSPIHRPQFIMLEWYRAGEHYEKIISDCFDLYKYCHEKLKDQGVSVIDFPDGFEVVYSSQTSKEVILGIDVFKEYPATVIEGDLDNSGAGACGTTSCESNTCAGENTCGNTGSCGGGCQG